MDIWIGEVSSPSKKGGLSLVLSIMNHVVLGWFIKKKKSYWDVLLWRSNKVKKIIFPCSSIENPIMSRPHIWGLIHITMHTWSLQLQGILFHGGTNSCADMLVNRGISPPERQILYESDYDTCLTFLWKCLYGNLFCSFVLVMYQLLDLSGGWTYHLCLCFLSGCCVCINLVSQVVFVC